MLITPLEQFQIISFFPIQLFCLDFSLTKGCLSTFELLEAFNSNVFDFLENFPLSGYAKDFFLKTFLKKNNPTPPKITIINIQTIGELNEGKNKTVLAGCVVPWRVFYPLG